MANSFTEPTWASIPEDGNPPQSIYALRGISPFEITGILVRLLQFYFSDADFIRNANLKDYIWTSNRRTSKILIEPGYNPDKRENFKLPAISVNRGEIKPFELPAPLKSLNMGVFVSGSNLARQELTNNDVEVKFIQGSHKLVCFGASGAEAEALIEEVYRRFIFFAPVIQQDFRLDSLDIAGVSEIQKIEENLPVRAFFGAIECKWQKQMMWSISTEEPV